MMNAASRYLYERSLGLLLLRVGVGLVFFMHGFSKLQDMAMTTSFFAHMGLPAWVAVAITWLELVGGVALIFGLATRLFAFLLGVEMLAAIFITGIGRGWPAHEMEALLVAVSFALVYMGSGRMSLFRMECHRCGAFVCRIEDCPKRK